MVFQKIKSHAKINLALHVIGKGKKLHKIESVVAFVELHDLIFLKSTNKKFNKISFSGKFSKNIKKINTVSLLLDLLFYKRLLKKKFDIEIIKNIPQQSGMGGGSMNASSILNYFIRKKIIKINKKKLLNITKLIGSDVILGINPVDTILSANGKIKKYKKKIKLYTLIVKPNFGCSTKNIFSKVKNFTYPKLNNPNKFLLNHKNLKFFENDLEVVVFKKYSELKKIKSFLLSTSNNIFVRMTGSGSSIVAYFQSKKACSLALKQFKKKFKRYWCIESKTI